VLWAGGGRLTGVGRAAWRRLRGGDIVAIACLGVVRVLVLAGLLTGIGWERTVGFRVAGQQSGRRQGRRCQRLSIQERTLDRLTLKAGLLRIARVRPSIKIMQKLFEGSAVSPLMPFRRIYVTIAVVWQEDGFQWCAADTRLVAGDDDQRATEIAAKIYAIPVVVSAMGNGFPRQPHYWTQYGFVYAGAALPAAMTAVTASTLLQKLTRPGDRANPPTF
jgi:hypothetical protein